MHHYRLIVIFLFLISGSGFTYAFSSELPQTFLDKEVTSQLSEDFQTLSPSHLAGTAAFFKDRVNLLSPAILVGEDFREYSREIAYFSNNRFIKPGLPLPDIIFPFHTFL
ncbi:hypothetical protein BH23BAC2_BH23BAC2_20820 [soil metagenome]